MSDATPNYRLEQQRLRTSLMQQQLRRSECLTKIMEAAERIDSERDNLAAHDKSIVKLEEQLAGLIKTHGEVTEQNILASAAKSVEVADKTN